jgi:hypothetical protein
VTATTNAGTATNASTTATAVPAAPVRRYRSRGRTARDRRLTPRFSDAELSVIRAAAEAARMTVTGFCAAAALAVAGGPADRACPSGNPAGRVGVEELAGLQRELFAARIAVNRTGTNLNQAVAALNSTGAAPVWLAHAVERVMTAVRHVDAVACVIHRRLG